MSINKTIIDHIKKDPYKLTYGTLGLAAYLDRLDHLGILSYSTILLISYFQESDRVGNTINNKVKISKKQILKYCTYSSISNSLTLYGVKLISGDYKEGLENIIQSFLK